MNIKYPVYRPHFTGRERERVLECIDSTWISSKGEYIARFEKRFAEFLGIKEAVSVNTGTAALHVAIEALGIGPGDEVLVPTLTYIASANAVKYAGAAPVLVDCEKDYWQIDVKDAERKITDRTRAIMPVHLYGHPCNMEAVMSLARKYSIHVIEDCAEAIGTRYQGQLVGTFGDVASFSFFGNKTITTGEGGMVVSNNPVYTDLASRIKGQGLAANREYWHDIIGYNYRMTNICAAIGLAQMDELDLVLNKKQEIAEWYRELLNGLPVDVHRVHPDAFHSYWMVSVLTEDYLHRDPLRNTLRKSGVETRPLFYPVHQMDMYDGNDGNYPVANDIAARGVTLPSYPDLSIKDVTHICECIREYFDSRMVNTC